MKFDSISSLDPSSIIDVIGAVTSVSDVSEVPSVKTNQVLQKRELVLVDGTQTAVKCTLWSEKALTWSTALSAGDSLPIVALKGVQVVHFQGVSLSALSTTTLQIDPEIMECVALREFRSGFEGGNITVKTSLMNGECRFWFVGAL